MRFSEIRLNKLYICAKHHDDDYLWTSPNMDDMVNVPLKCIKIHAAEEAAEMQIADKPLSIAFWFYTKWLEPINAAKDKCCCDLETLMVRGCLCNGY